ncbi:hypothetical protein BRADI_4g17444v3 [Brachypodium distachyon]|uniref:Uncharacterized protein n=1 Tax=Brachypodium distachyon TaxID=15368 RepID=A0A2K2CNH6_BRADI|nr:hypothetical protein BRADI_4g17444v3 [Brachypodium distachyon]
MDGATHANKNNTQSKRLERGLHMSVASDVPATNIIDTIGGARAARRRRRRGQARGVLGVGGRSPATEPGDGGARDREQRRGRAGGAREARPRGEGERHMGQTRRRGRRRGARGGAQRREEAAPARGSRRRRGGHGGGRSSVGGARGQGRGSPRGEAGEGGRPWELRKEEIEGRLREEEEEGEKTSGGG